MPTMQPEPTNKRSAEDFTITRPDQLHALSNATRWRILGRLIDQPASIQELARSLGTAKGTIGHHVRVLESAGMIRVVDRTPVRGVIEKRYARVGGKFRLPEGEAASALGKTEELNSMPLRAALAEARPSTEEDESTMSVVVRARMPADRARRFAELLSAVAAEFADGAPQDGETFGLVAAIYVPDWSR